MQTLICILTSVDMGEYSGVQKFALDLTENICTRKHSVVLISRKNSIPLVSVLAFKSPSLSSLRQLTSHRFTKRKMAMNFVHTLLFFIFATLAAFRVYKRHRMAIIHAQDVFFSGFAGMIVHKLFSVPLIVHAHGPSPYFSEPASETTELRRILAKCLAKVVIHNSDLVLATDIHTKNLLSSLEENVKMMCIPTPIHTKTYSAKRENSASIPGTPDKSLLLGFIGRLTAQKNLRLLLTAFALAKARSNEKFKLLVVGDGPERFFLEREARRLKIDKEIIFAGTVTENKKVDLLAALDVFLMPSLYEGCPIALLEAMAGGKAIISSDIACIRSIARHGEEAILVNPYDVEELKQAILLLLNDLSLRTMLGNKARERAKLYDANNIFNQLLEIYRKVICHARNKSIER